MIDILDVRHLLIRPCLEAIGLHSRAAENLLVGTGLVESEFRHLIQLNGIALSFFQIEPNTFNWLIKKLSNDKELMLKTIRFLGYATLPTNSSQLLNSFALACILARLKYWYVPERLPAADNIEGLAKYWGKYYNTLNKKKDIDRFIFLYDKFGEHNSD